MRKWSRRHNRWGPDERWSAWFGGGVVDALVETLDLHLQSPTDISGRYDPRPAVLGAVPWMTHPDVIDRLSHFEACIVTSKLEGRYRKKIADYAENASGFRKEALVELDDWGPRGADGLTEVIGPWTRLPLLSDPLGPVRVLGYRGDKTPILHAKLLLLGVVYWLEDHEFLTERLVFRPQRLWWGSANFTTFSQSHLEIGTLTDDPGLIEHAYRYLLDIIRLSEPFHSQTLWPTPDLAEAEWDDAAFEEYVAEHVPEAEEEN